ncbi:carboxypeptidase B-like [Neocloeon triangulifer]|uniref:carboxypeptidase B-like n=1 Tax=Neocloeon triangulifer TaxID=2078957 RepID=UPI00286F84F4|nr:carboxypeptidase B-like [Neocloeon triangulifer]
MLLQKRLWVAFILITISLTATGQSEESDSDGTTTESIFEESTKLPDSQIRNLESEPANLRGAQLIRIRLKNDEHKRVFKELAQSKLINIWKHTRGPKSFAIFMVLQENVEKVHLQLFEANIQPKIMAPDVQKLIDEENPANTTIYSDSNSFRAGYTLNWDAYHRASVIHDFLDYYAANYASLCTVKTIGKTFENRPIKLIKISAGGATKRPAIFIDGGIHAREWIAPATVSYIIKELVENRSRYSSFANAIDFHIVPLLNVDGYEYTHTSDRLWRKNRAKTNSKCFGVDVNRNFGYKWGGVGASRSACSEVYRGPSAFSELESKAIQDYIMSFNVGFFNAYFTIHSFGQWILYPWGYAYSLPPDSAVLQQVGDTAAAAIKALSQTSYTVGNSAKLLYRASGCSDDWAKAVPQIKYSYTVELADQGTYGFILPASYIKPTGEDLMALIRVFAEKILQTTNFKEP